MNKSIKEIERKWLIKSLDKKYIQRTTTRYQGYLFNDPGELRIVKKYESGRCLISLKTDGSLIRDEWEQEIPEWAFNIMQAHVKNHLSIIRHFINLDSGHLLEIDVYAGKLKGLIKVEVEFKENEDINDFVLPDWLQPAVEVTEDLRFKNKNLSLINEKEAKLLLKEVNNILGS